MFDIFNTPEVKEIKKDFMRVALVALDQDLYGIKKPDCVLEQKFDGKKYLGIFTKETGEQITDGFSGDW